MSYRLKRFIRGLRFGLLREVFFEHDLKNIPNIEPRLPVAMKVLGESEISRIREVAEFSDQVFNKRMKREDTCFVSEKSERLLSFHWLQTKGNHFVKPTGQWEKIKEGEAVIYHVFVHKDFRGNKLNGHAYSHILRHCRDLKIKRVWIYTHKSNIANIKGLKAINFKMYRETLSLRFNNRYYLLRAKEL